MKSITQDQIARIRYAIHELQTCIAILEDEDGDIEDALLTLRVSRERIDLVLKELEHDAI